MIEVLKVRYENGGGWDTLYQPVRQTFPTVETAREFYKKKLGANKILLWYAEKL